MDVTETRASKQVTPKKKKKAAKAAKPRKTRETHATILTESQLEECRNVKRLFEKEKERSGMTHPVLARMIGKSHQTISAIINERTGVTIEVGRALAVAFDVPLKTILPWTTELVEHADIIADIENLNDTNRQFVLRMMRNLLDSQEGF